RPPSPTDLAQLLPAHVRSASYPLRAAGQKGDCPLAEGGRSPFGPAVPGATAPPLPGPGELALLSASISARRLTPGARGLPAATQPPGPIPLRATSGCRRKWRVTPNRRAAPGAKARYRCRRAAHERNLAWGIWSSAPAGPADGTQLFLSARRDQALNPER